MRLLPISLDTCNISASFVSSSLALTSSSSLLLPSREHSSTPPRENIDDMFKSCLPNKSYACSLYTSTYSHVASNVTTLFPFFSSSFLFLFSISRNTVSKLLGIIPRFSNAPSFPPVIVCVFPDPVCPYANIVPLTPSKQFKTTFLAHTSKVSSCDAFSSKISSKKVNI